MPALSFFIGKGGVGKTTVSAAYAVRAAARRSRGEVLLLSTDPAHSLADVFGMRLGAAPARLPGSRLRIWQVDAAKQFRAFLGRYRRRILDLVESGTIFSRSEIEPLLDTTLPGMAEIAALLAIHRSLDSYSEIVVDTAPIGHTLRLFEMPEHFARFLDFLDVAGSRDRVLARTFGGRAVSHPFLSEWRRMVEDVQQALRGPESRIVLVTTPETFALNESVRAAGALAEALPGLAPASIVLNRVVRQAGSCAPCRRRAAAARSASTFLRQNFRGAPLLVGEDHGDPIIGAAALRRFASHVFDGRKLRLSVTPPRAASVELKPVAWPGLASALSLTLGKGGVGKTTLSAALAFRHRAASRRPVVICSTDPAPSLDDIFQSEVGDTPSPVLGDRGLLALEADSLAAFRRWSSDMRSRLDRAFTSETRGVHVDLSFDRRVIAALLDIVPPGVDELFAIFRILDLLEQRPQTVLIDMAPTGHALELLRMPARMLQWSRLLLKSLAAHRTLPLAQDLAVEIASLGQRVRDLLSRLHERAQVWAVMLAEPLPDRETGRLLQDLEGLGIRPTALFVNRVLSAAELGSCRRCRRAHTWQMATLAGLRRRGRSIYVVRDFGREIAGAPALQSFTKELWRLE